MISLLRAIIWIVLFFLIFRIIRMIIKAVSAEVKNENLSKKKESNYRIKEEDIIEAKFEELKPNVKDNSKDDS